MDRETAREHIIKDIIEYLSENESVFNDIIEELDRWNGFLGEDRFYEMEEINELYSGTDPIDILYRAFYGHDADTWSTDSHGKKEYGQFNPNRDFFKFNGYGNLVSTDYPDYSGYLDSYFVEECLDALGHLYTVDEDEQLKELFDALEDLDSQDDDEPDEE